MGSATGTSAKKNVHFQPERKADSRSLNDFAAADRAEGTVQAERNRVSAKAHRAIDEGELQAAGMVAAKAVGVRPVGWRGEVVGRRGDGAAGADGTGPVGPPVRPRDVRRFADQEGVAGSIDD